MYLGTRVQRGHLSSVYLFPVATVPLLSRSLPTGCKVEIDRRGCSKALLGNYEWVTARSNVLVRKLTII